MDGKEDAVKVGELPIQESARTSAAVRAAIVAMKSGNSGGAKGGRKAKTLKPENGTNTCDSSSNG
jgi:hypothetical protein